LQHLDDEFRSYAHHVLSLIDDQVFQPLHEVHQVWLPLRE